MIKLLCKRFYGLPLIIGFCWLAGCSTEVPGRRPTIPMNWQAVDSLNQALPEGIRLYAGSNDSLPLRAWYVSIAEADPRITTRVVVSDDSSDNRETVSSFAHDLGAAVAVNGGYFTMNITPARHYGLLVCGGVMVSPATTAVTRDSIHYDIARAAIGFSGEGDVDIAWVTSQGDTIFRWDEPPAHRPGQAAAFPGRSAGKTWPLFGAIGAGPGLLKEGEIRVTADQEVFFGTSIPEVHPRTAAGLGADGHLILMVVDGRQRESRGVSLEELARLMLEVGVVEALNLDGGGSSALVVNHTLVNRPAGSTVEREVMSAIATFVNTSSTVPRHRSSPARNP